MEIRWRSSGPSVVDRLDRNAPPLASREGAFKSMVFLSASIRLRRRRQ